MASIYKLMLIKGFKLRHGRPCKILVLVLVQNVYIMVGKQSKCQMKITLPSCNLDTKIFTCIK